MFRSGSLPNRYEINEGIVSSSNQWKDNHMYKSSYHVMSEKNVKIFNYRT
jgi:hypothetical protein